ncbi:hypothetical protein PMAYCL1PPCAC_15325, partial [Pristionchus mayeri]
SRLDIVVLGATGFTGSYIVRAIASSPLFQEKSIAVAGRNEAKLRDTLTEIEKDTGVLGVSFFPVIVADTSDDDSLTSMARQARVIINAVGPFRLHGEQIVKAAVENGASYVDVAGEPAFLEKVEMKFAKLARENGVYVVGACGFDSIPSDLGTDFLKRNFDGTLGYVEAFLSNSFGPSGYSFSTTSYDTLMLGLSSTDEDKLGEMRRTIMPERLPSAKHKVPKRSTIWKVDEEEMKGWVLPFPGADKSVVKRSQYYDFHVNGMKPVQMEPYLLLGSLSNALLLTGWITFFEGLSSFEWTRKWLKAYPEQFSFNMFKNSGPTKQQMEESHFDYFLFGRGWAPGEQVDEQNPSQRVSSTKTITKICQFVLALAVCHGPDLGYIGTSGCVASAALALLYDIDRLPKEGGVYTTASAFRDTRIFDYLKSFGVTFEMVPLKENSKL